jgi:predicted regulator of amino acid metabolism with ACT domain
MATAKSLQKKVEARIDRAYRAMCSGVEIDMFDISKVFAVGRAAVAEGVDDAVLGERIKAFVETIRRN